jgi:hypothetical protein
MLTFADGRLHFMPNGSDSPLPLDQVQAIRFPLAPAPPLLAGMAVQVALPRGQQLTGGLLELDGERLQLRTAWAEDLSLPRSAVRALTQLPGEVTYFVEDFADGLRHATMIGTPRLADQPAPSGGRALVLSSPGQAAEWTLDDPLQAGAFGTDFRASAALSGAHWLVEADFQAQGQPRTVRVTVAGDGAWSAEVPLLKGRATRTPALPGWHRLRVDFAAASLVVAVDDTPLWYTGEQGPGGPLRRVRLRCAGVEGGARGDVAFAALSMARAVDDLRQPATATAQDAVWHVSGDQIFGTVTRAGRHTVEVEGRFGKRALPWGDVRGLLLRRAAPAPQTTDGEHVRVRLRPGVGSGRDGLEGVLVALDDSRLTLQHALLGECRIDRACVRELRPLFHGRRLELDDGFHHLGESGTLDPTLDPPRAEGPGLRWTFNLDAVPEGARLVVEAVRLKGPGDGIGPALERGERRTEVLVNGRGVDYLNHHIDRALEEPRRVAVDLPAGVLRTGENVVEVRQTPERASERVEHCGVAGVAVEVPR